MLKDTQITINTKINEIQHLPEFEDCKQYLAGSGPIGWRLGKLRISQLSGIWPIQSIAESFQYMKELVDDGNRIYYPLYEDPEKRKAVEGTASKLSLDMPLNASSDFSGRSASEKNGLKEQVMFHFPVKERTKIAIIVAGGGYSMVCSFVEGFPVAKRMNELGYHAFVVNYRTLKNARVPNPMDDLAIAIRYITAHEEELNIDASGYLLGGFSAGGHLAGCMGLDSIGCVHYGLPKPGTLFLAYPVITMGEQTHPGSRKNLLGKDSGDPDLIRKYSIECNITGSYPPVYLWQCAADNTVPVENSRMLNEQLTLHQVPHIYRTFDSNAHGWGIGTGTPADGWFDEAVSFWQKSL